MRLLQLDKQGNFSLVEHVGNNIPPYAILSHTWGGDEVTFRDIVEGKGVSKDGFRKIRFCGEQATKDNLQLFWVDTCCIDKSSSAELTESINSMFRWYQKSEKCYVYMTDITIRKPVESRSPSDDSLPEGILNQRLAKLLERSRWFTRGWTLQELIAPVDVDFFSADGTWLGNKRSLERILHTITKVPIGVLRGSISLNSINKTERMSWAAGRCTQREEDEAYSLLGLFGVHMPLLYGEGREKAFVRLRRECQRDMTDGHEISDKQRRTLLDALRFDEIDTRRMTIQEAHVHTCQWLLNDPVYRDWLDETKLVDHCGFLWIKGKPGTGKSTIMKFAFVNTQESATENEVVISFFFNARGEDLEKSTVGAYRSLLLQLLTRIPELQATFGSLGMVGSRWTWTLASLKILFKKVIHSLGDVRVRCFIDALDESNEEDIRDMLSFLEHTCEVAVATGIKFYICLASRHYPHISIRQGLSMVLEGQEGHNQDIASYINSELRIGHGKFVQEVQNELLVKASGIFMWVILVVRILNKEFDGGRIHSIKKRLHELPGDLQELFREILVRDPDNRVEMMLCLQYILVASRPLSPKELYFAILASRQTEDFSRWDNEITPSAIGRFIVNASKGLAEVAGKVVRRRVQFIHESVKDFLLIENVLGHIWAEAKGNFSGNSHESLKNACLSYITSEGLARPRKYPSLTFIMGKAQSRKSIVTGDYPFLQYALANLLYHANAAAATGICQKSFLQRFPHARYAELNASFEFSEDKWRRTSSASLLYVLTVNEVPVPHLVKMHASPVSSLFLEDQYYGCPLYASIAQGDMSTLRVLLDGIVQRLCPSQDLSGLINKCLNSLRPGELYGLRQPFQHGHTVLTFLARHGLCSLMQLLIETRALHIHEKNEVGSTPLATAAARGHEEIVQLLLSSGDTDIDSQDINGRTPLWHAEEGEHERVVSLLLAAR